MRFVKTLFLNYANWTVQYAKYPIRKMDGPPRAEADLLRCVTERWRGEPFLAIFVDFCVGDIVTDGPHAQGLV